MLLALFLAQLLYSSSKLLEPIFASSNISLAIVSASDALFSVPDDCSNIASSEIALTETSTLDALDGASDLAPAQIEGYITDPGTTFVLHQQIDKTNIAASEIPPPKTSVSHVLLGASGLPPS